MIISINYADESFKTKQKLNSWTAKHIGKVDKVISYSPKDIDGVFFKKHRDILTEKRGGGLWLWKPYIIKNSLLTLSDGDYLMYVDSGVLFKGNIKSLIKKLESSGQDIMLFALPLPEFQWTKKEVLNHLEMDDIDSLCSSQIMGTILCLKKTHHSLSFTDRWLELCTNKEMLMPPTKEGIKQYRNFIAHREDQSLLSVVSKEYNIKPFSDPTDYGKFPYRYLAKNRFFYLKDYEKEYLIKTIYFLHVRKANPYIYYLKYLFKVLLSRFGIKRL